MNILYVKLITQDGLNICNFVCQIREDYLAVTIQEYFEWYEINGRNFCQRKANNLSKNWLLRSTSTDFV